MTDGLGTGGLNIKVNMFYNIKKGPLKIWGEIFFHIICQTILEINAEAPWKRVGLNINIFLETGRNSEQNRLC